MNRDDALQTVERHATSKLPRKQDRLPLPGAE